MKNMLMGAGGKCSMKHESMGFDSVTSPEILICIIAGQKNSASAKKRL